MNTTTVRSHAILWPGSAQFVVSGAPVVKGIKRVIPQVLRFALAVAIAHHCGGASAQELNQAERDRLTAGMERAAQALSGAMGDAGRRGALAQRFMATPKRRVVLLSDVGAESAAAENLGRLGALNRFVLRLPAQDKLSAMSATLGTQNVYVVVDPLLDEAKVRTLVGYSGGKRTELNASVPPDGPVFVIGLNESETLDPTYPLPMHITPPDETGDGRIIDDFVGVAQIRISNDHEPWYKGDPEIVVKVRRFMQPSGVFQDLQTPLPSVNEENRWYALGDPNSTYLFFDNRWASSYELVVWEEDSPDSDDVVGVFIVNWRQLPFGGFTERSNRDARIRLDRD